MLTARVYLDKEFLSIDLHINCTKYKNDSKNNSSSKQHFGFIRLEIYINKNKKEHYQNKNSQKLRNKVPKSVTTSLHYLRFTLEFPFLERGGSKADGVLFAKVEDDL